MQMQVVCWECRWISLWGHADRLLLPLALDPLPNIHGEQVLLVPQLHLGAVPIGGASFFSTTCVLCCVLCIKVSSVVVT